MLLYTDYELPHPLITLRALSVSVAEALNRTTTGVLLDFGNRVLVLIERGSTLDSDECFANLGIQILTFEAPQ